MHGLKSNQYVFKKCERLDLFALQRSLCKILVLFCAFYVYANLLTNYLTMRQNQLLKWVVNVETKDYL